MTDNELIAEWRGTLVVEDGSITCAPVGTVVGENTAESPYDNVRNYDTDITLWHGEDGLLAEIDEKGMEFAKLFGEKVLGLVRHIRVISILRATPAQLTAALVAVIKEE